MKTNHIATNDKANQTTVELEVRHYATNRFCIYMYSPINDWSMKIEVTPDQAIETAKVYNLKIHKHE